MTQNFACMGLVTIIWIALGRVRQCSAVRNLSSSSTVSLKCRCRLVTAQS